MRYTKEDLTPVTPQEEMLVMALLRKMRGLPLEIKVRGEYVPLVANNIIDIYSLYHKPEPKKLSIPWEVVSPEWNYAAMDEVGKVWFYTEKPTKKKFTWEVEDYIESMQSCLALDTTGIDWQTSLTVRGE